jgi:hypothetical protein
MAILKYDIVPVSGENVAYPMHGQQQNLPFFSRI